MRQSVPVLVILAGMLWTAPCGATEALPAAAPEAHGFDSAKLAEVLPLIDASGLPIHGLLLMRGGEVILDSYFYPYDGRTPHDLASVTKSVTTSLIAIAAGEGRLDLDAPLLSFFPGRAVANRDDRKERITVRHLTQMTSGLACIGIPEEVTLDEMEASPDFVQFALDLPMVAEPGTTFSYCSPGMHLLSAILTRATGRTALDYGREKLFAPLGITETIWDTDPQGVTRGWGDLHLLPHDMAKLGMLWLYGAAWEGRQIIPADWFKAATTEPITADRYEDYGYGFWIGPKQEPIPYFMASGRGGQRILMAPALDLIIVSTGGGFDPGDVIDPVLAALTDPAQALPPNAEGEAKLAAALAAIAAPPEAQPVPPPPAMAAQISGRTYRLPPNFGGLISVRLDFPGGAEAVLTLADAQGAPGHPVGLDGVYRFSPGESGMPIGVTGAWTDESTFVLDYNTIGNIRAFTITARYAGDGMEMTILSRDEGFTLTLAGEAE